MLIARHINGKKIEIPKDVEEKLKEVKQRLGIIEKLDSRSRTRPMQRPQKA